ncbi:MAG: Hsp20/alpha crystallin family protein [Mailhella sp.]|nr:Hsp20/alpha crystallin family protein [Mailhella sp.]
MNTDVRELDHTYELDVDLPGFKKEDVTVELSKGYLTITASHEETEEEQEKKGQYLRRERWSGACSRTFYIGEGLEPADVHARFDNGILNLSFPKTPAEKKPDQKYVNII